jgi:hypothetical protein
MLVIVGDRRQGKTTHLLQWMLKGKQLDDYPGWSRALVCHSHVEVVRVTGILRHFVAGQIGQGWYPELVEAPQMDKQFDRALADLHKAVWSVEELEGVFRHLAPSADFEYAIDNIDFMFNGNYRRPSFIAITGELYAG